MPSVRMFARTTMTAAFQRMNARIRRSTCSSPGNHGSSSAGIVLTYGVETVAGNSTCSARARSSSFISRYRARIRPWVSTISSNESTHSAVSPGSMSGTWWDTPSNSTAPRYPSQPAERPFPPVLAPFRPGRVVHMAHAADAPFADDPLANDPFANDGVHRRVVSGEPRAGRLGVGGARRAVRQWRRPADDEPADGGHRRPRGSAGPPGRRRRRRRRRLQRLDVRRQLLPRPVVGRLAPPELAEHRRASRWPTGTCGSR